MSTLVHRFGRFTLCRTRRLLCADQRPVHLEPRAFDLLCYLVEHRGRVVPRRELLLEVWGDAPVTGSVLPTALSAVRAALGDTGSTQHLVRTLRGLGYQFVAPTSVVTADLDSLLTAEAVPAAEPVTTAPAITHGTRGTGTDAGVRDVIRFCRTTDGARIAWAAVGSGPPLVKTANWLSRLDLERESPLFRHWFDGLARGRQLIRYDERGCGLSEQSSGFTLEEWMADLDAVVDAAGLDRFPLLGVSVGAPLAVAYAALRPERVSRLAVHAGFIRGPAARARDDTERDQAALDLNLALSGWQEGDRSYLWFWASQHYADSSPSRWDEFAEYTRQTTSAENRTRFMTEMSRLDVTELASRITCPTLVMHSRDDRRVPFSQATELADLVPNSRLVLFDGRNHLLMPDEPAWSAFVTELHAFLDEGDVEDRPREARPGDPGA
ncbi:alpha/beta fold hydrolase [Phycicoccus sp. CSK15P-2]|uniref:alpha/beta fold hydrolase n=1 Tax=Phycicoccus sp. CSK15P-2 TaxID=2807627 RepID=UPI0019515A0C|nr:alpha/beta fold hydrolase [Phycicoccus sp. CSK15P-2]MBM6403440.1 alpha/beta fold hydrolase [Phycicoccus sp. CSK15P-2]